MDERWRRTFGSWAREPGYRRLVAETLRAIRRELAVARRPFVAFSGGKDSTVLVHLVLRCDPEVEVLHWDYGPFFVPRPIHERILANARGLGARRLRVETSPSYQRLGRRARNVLGREMIGGLLPRMAEEGYDLVFVGLRAEEAVGRRCRIEAGRSLSVVREAWPLARWRWLDVWAYVVEHEIPYLAEIYDSAAELVGWDRARWTTLQDPEFAHVAAAVDGVAHWRWRHTGPGETPEIE
ncbi:MAG TPA: phosphoadenosine phosphosulfate reductase family protein [Actinomycetota bacterium]|nr:phosphoadenosine phosphosulfate reductase family protein [Actinomycetota bacterium]